MSSAQAARLHEAVMVISEAGFKRYSTTDRRTLPAIAYSAGEPAYGVISTDVSSPRAPPRTVESFNSGCANPHDCVSDEGFGCPGPLKTASPAMFADLNRPFAPDRFDTQPPPSYVAGIKTTGINSVLGWQTGADGRPLWEGLRLGALPGAADVWF